MKRATPPDPIAKDQAEKQDALERLRRDPAVVAADPAARELLLSLLSEHEESAAKAA